MIRKQVVDQNTGKTVDGTLIEVIDAKEPFTILELADGTIVRVRLAVSEVVRLDEPDSNGKFIYNFTSQMIVTIHHQDQKQSN